MSAPLLDEDEKITRATTIDMISRPKIPLYPPCTMCGKRYPYVRRLDTNKKRVILLCDNCLQKVRDSLKMEKPSEGESK
jgi:predicted SprT family Zn-dependent metalloprotease